MEGAIEDSDPHEELVHRHRKEKKELQAQIQALKKTATKGDKKKKKEVSEEISKLETELEKRHAEELATLKEQANDVEESLNHLTINEGTFNGDDCSSNGLGSGKRVTKAQRRREKKAAALRELRIIEQEVQNISGTRSQETEKIKEILKARGLMIQDVPPDGNCLYCAVSDQLKEPLLTVSKLRALTAQVLRENSTQYLPFLSHPDTGEMLTESQFEDYCTQVADTPAWGGQVELRALCQALHRSIEVIQSECPSIILGSEFRGDRYGGPLVITYHRHMYELGEHYNSTRAWEPEELEDPLS